MKKLIYLWNMENHDKHIDAYIKDTLKTPQFSLSDDFADKITEKVEKKMAWNQYMKEFMIYFGTIIGVISTPLIIIFFLNQETWERILNIFYENPAITIGIIIILFFILFTDRFLLRYFFKIKKIN